MKAWLKLQGASDAIVLTEVKCLGKELKQKLNVIDSQLHWVYTAHYQKIWRDCMWIQYFMEKLDKQQKTSLFIGGNLS